MAGHDPERTRRVASKARKAIMHHVQYVPHEEGAPEKVQHASEADTEHTMEKLGQGAGSGDTKKLHLDLPMHMQLRDADAHKEPGGSDALGGGPVGMDDEGSAGPHDKQHASADPEESGDHKDPKSQLGPVRSTDPNEVDSEAGEEGAARGKDLLGPSMQHGMVHSATVKKILGAYKRSK